MSRLLNFLKNNKIPVLVGIALGLILLLPQLELIFILGEDYNGIPINEIDNDEFYNSRARDVYDGNFLVKSPRVYWPEAEYAMIPALGEAVVAAIARVTGLSVGTVPLVTNFLFPFVLYLFLFVLFHALTRSRLVSILAAAGVILISNLTFFPREFFTIFTDFSALTPSPYNRPVVPQVSSVVFFIFLLLFFLFLKNEKKPLLIASGVVFGLLFYTYLYAWTFATVLLGLYFLIFILRKQYTQAKKLLLIGLIGLGVSSFFWVNYFRVSALPVYDDMQKRFGFINSRTPIWNNLLFLDAIFILVMAWFKKSWSKNIQFVFLFVVAGFILINQQVITNYRFFPGHWHWYFIVPISIFIFIWFANFVVEKLNRTYLKITLAIILASLIFTNGILSQHAYFLKHKENYTDLQRFARVYDWIDQNTRKDLVILVNRDKFNTDLSEKLTVFTSAYSYLPDIADRVYLIPQEYFRHAYFVSLFLEGKTNPETDVRQDDFRLMTVLFGFYNRYQFKCMACYTDEEITGLKDDYSEFLEQDFETALKQYKLDYAIWDTKRDKLWNLDQYDFLEPLTEINGIKIYSVT